MKQAAELLRIPHRGEPISSVETTRVGNPTERDKQVINDLFSRLSAIFPAWRHAFDGDEAIREAKRAWLSALIRNGVTTPELIQQGLVQAERQTTPFLPSVGQFIAWCKGDGDEKSVCSPVLGIEYTRPEKPNSREDRLSMISRFGPSLRDALRS